MDKATVKRVLDSLSGVNIPGTLIGQYLPISSGNAMENSLSAEELNLDTIEWR